MRIHAWDDPILTVGSGAISWFAEEADLWWLPRIGPTSLLAGRRLLAYVGDTTTLVELGQLLGVKSHSRMRSTLGRLIRFGLAVERTDGYAVRTVLPAPSRAHIMGCGPAVQRLWFARHPETAEVWGVDIAGVPGPTDQEESA